MYSNQLKAYDEFASVFKGSMKPHITIKDVPIKKLFLFLDNSVQSQCIVVVSESGDPERSENYSKSPIFAKNI